MTEEQQRQNRQSGATLRPGLTAEEEARYLEDLSTSVL